MVGPHSPLLNPSATGVDMLRSLNAEVFPGYHIAFASEPADQKQPLVVVGGPMDEVGTYEGIQTRRQSTQRLSLAPTDESSTLFDSY